MVNFSFILSKVLFQGEMGSLTVNYVCCWVRGLTLTTVYWECCWFHPRQQ